MWLAKKCEEEEEHRQVQSVLHFTQTQTNPLPVIMCQITINSIYALMVSKAKIDDKCISSLTILYHWILVPASHLLDMTLKQGTILLQLRKNIHSKMVQVK